MLAQDTGNTGTMSTEVQPPTCGGVGEEDRVE